MLTALRFVSLFLMGLDVGLSFSHVLQWPIKVRYGPALYVAVQQSLYSNYGPAASAYELAAMAAALAWLWLVRHRPREFGRTRLGVLCIGAMLAVFLLRIRPLNAQQAAWTVRRLPANWHVVRDQWQLWHAIRVGVAALGWAALLAAALGREPSRRAAAAAN
ncbi:hypothetical protein [Hymenobacter sp.]|uniref:hypothetical protein n=1 Tax=Hymenobacter sp. TaxID=1898978 RepID=UPI00286B5337|nr:hypothetical protein [Hymenobacter sp.]